MDNLPQHLRAEVARRRTFAIISHPDAGKTTLTDFFPALTFLAAVQPARKTPSAA